MKKYEMVLICVQLVLDGIIVFAVQKVIESKFNKLNAKHEFREKIYNEYFEKIDSIYDLINKYMEKDCFENSYTIDTGEIDPEIFNEYMEEIKESCKELNAYYDKNKSVLGKNRKLDIRRKELGEIIDNDDNIKVYNKIVSIINTVYDEALKMVV